MKKFGITAHCLVRNEERWIWYAICSVIKYVDKVLVFDTGSTDRTVDIIKSIKNPKIVFEEKGVVDKLNYTALRMEMIDKTKTSWFMVLDGDEIWPEATIKELLLATKEASLLKHAVVVGEWMCQGDVFHYSAEIESLRDPLAPDRLSGYRLARAVRKIPGIHCINLYGSESYEDSKNKHISEWKRYRLIYIKNKFFHMSFLTRSSDIRKDREVMMRSYKTRFYTGVPFPKDIKYPEIFYTKRPNFVPNPWRKFTHVDWLKGILYRSVNFTERILIKYKILRSQFYNEI